MTELYMTAKGRGVDVTEAITESDALLGAPSSSDWLDGYTPKFLDYPFTEPDISFSDHLRVVRRVEPRLAVAPDIEKGRTLDEAVEAGDELLKHADDVILVPKSVHPDRVPDRFRVGMSVGDFGSCASWSVWRYRDCDSVHILGGSPNEQLTICNHLNNVESVDTATLGQRCRFGIWDGKCVDDPPEEWDYKRRLYESLNNYAQELAASD